MRHRPPRRPRPVALLAGALALLMATAACGSDSQDDDATAEAPPRAEEGAFPVTLEHRYGETTVEEEPRRIVTVGLTDQDTVLALGKVPVGTTEWLGLHEAAIGPWAADLVGDADLPTLLEDPGTGPQVEAIAQLDPDLILALYSGITEEQYESLSRIAPGL